MADCLIDSGNSRLKLARREPTGWQMVATLDFDDPQLFERSQAILSDPSLERLFLASVSKGWRAERLNAILMPCRQPVTRIESMPKLGRLRTAYPHPKQLGVDRFLALLAASELAKDVLLMSFGTALTLDVLGADGRHHGGVIAPSPDFQWQSMRDYFPGLFESPGRAQRLADNTPDALATGIEHQILGMVERIIREAFKDGPAEILVSGGAAEPWMRILPRPNNFVPDLLFQGMLRYIELSGL